MAMSIAASCIGNALNPDILSGSGLNGVLVQANQELAEKKSGQDSFVMPAVILIPLPFILQDRQGQLGNKATADGQELPAESADLADPFKDELANQAPVLREPTLTFAPDLRVSNDVLLSFFIQQFSQLKEKSQEAVRSEMGVAVAGAERSAQEEQSAYPVENSDAKEESAPAAEVLMLDLQSLAQFIPQPALVLPSVLPSVVLPQPVQNQEAASLRPEVVSEGVTAPAKAKKPVQPMRSMPSMQSTPHTAAPLPAASTTVDQHEQGLGAPELTPFIVPSPVGQVGVAAPSSSKEKIELDSTVKSAPVREQVQDRTQNKTQGRTQGRTQDTQPVRAPLAQRKQPLSAVKAEVDPAQLTQPVHMPAMPEKNTVVSAPKAVDVRPVTTSPASPMPQPILSGEDEITRLSPPVQMPDVPSKGMVFPAMVMEAVDVKPVAASPVQHRQQPMPSISRAEIEIAQPMLSTPVMSAKSTATPSVKTPEVQQQPKPLQQLQPQPQHQPAAAPQVKRSSQATSLISKAVAMFTQGAQPKTPDAPVKNTAMPMTKAPDVKPVMMSPASSTPSSLMSPMSEMPQTRYVGRSQASPRQAFRAAAGVTPQAGQAVTSQTQQAITSQGTKLDRAAVSATPPDTQPVASRSERFQVTMPNMGVERKQSHVVLSDAKKEVSNKVDVSDVLSVLPTAPLESGVQRIASPVIQQPSTPAPKQDVTAKQKEILAIRDKEGAVPETTYRFSSWRGAPTVKISGTADKGYKVQVADEDKPDGIQVKQILDRHLTGFNASSVNSSSGLPFGITVESATDKESGQRNMGGRNKKDDNDE